MVDAPVRVRRERGDLTTHTPPAVSKIDMPVGVEDDSLGFEHRALQARMLAIGRDATPGIDDAVPRNRSFRCGTHRPPDADGRESVLDHPCQLPVGDDTAARNSSHDAPHALEGANRLPALSRGSPLPLRTGHTRRFYAHLERMSPDNLQRVRVTSRVSALLERGMPYIAAGTSLSVWDAPGCRFRRVRRGKSLL